MVNSSFLVDPKIPLVLDTSVLVNLHACKYGARILSSLPNMISVPQTVAVELNHETSKSNGEHQFIQDLVESGTVSIVDLNENEYEIYEALVSRSPSLGDGEAATIAIASNRGQLSVIDEHKGRMLAEHYCELKPPAWSFDLLRNPHVLAVLSSAEASDALFFALRDGRMRVHEDHCDLVLAVIGPQKALECKSLPGYKFRKWEWQRQAEQMPAVSELDESKAQSLGKHNLSLL